jgi:pentatricopeptide repeat domain-containing protein 1
MANYACAGKMTSTSPECSESSIHSPVGKRQKKGSISATNVRFYFVILFAIFLIDACWGDVIWGKNQAENLDVWTSIEWALVPSLLLFALCKHFYSCKSSKTTPLASKSISKAGTADTRSKCAGKFSPSSAPSMSQKPSISSQKSRALLEQLAQEGDAERAQALFRDMERNGVRPDGVTPNIVMRAFTKKGDLVGAERWLDEMKAKGMEISACTYNTILDACAKLEKPELSEKWLSRMHENGVCPNIVTFATLISAHARRGNEEKAVALFEHMKAAGMTPDVVCYNALIHACSVRGNCKGVAHWVREMEGIGIQPSVTTFTAAIDACAKKGNIDEAESWMSHMVAAGLQPNVVSYSSLIDACAKVGKPERAGFWYDQMLEVGVTPNSYTFSAVISACGKAGDVAAAEAWLARAQAADIGIASDPVLYSCVIDACAKKNDADRAWRVFEQMQALGVRPHIVTYATLARPFAQRGDYHRVEQLEKLMTAQGVAVNEYFLYAQLIAYSKARPRQEGKAVAAFRKGLAQGLQINERILAALRRAIGRKSALALHEEATKARLGSPASVAEMR